MGRSRFRRPPSAVGAVLRRLRLERDMSQAGLAMEAGVSARHLGFVELGRSKPSAALLDRLADALQAPAADRAAMFVAAGHVPPGEELTEMNWAWRLVDSCPYAVAAFDRRLAIVVANEAHVRLMGAPSRLAILGKNMRRDQIWSRPEARELILSCLRDGSTASFEVWGTTRFGRSFCARGRISPVRDSVGRVVGLQTLMREMPIAHRDTRRVDCEIFSRRPA